MISDLKFGDVVIIPHQLRRISENRRDAGSVLPRLWNVWKADAFVKGPRTGILIGFRTLANGTISYDEDYGRVFKPREYIKAVLVALGPRTNPVLALLDDVQNEIFMRGNRED